MSPRIVSVGALSQEETTRRGFPTICPVTPGIALWGLPLATIGTARAQDAGDVPPDTREPTDPPLPPGSDAYEGPIVWRVDIDDDGELEVLILLAGPLEEAVFVDEERDGDVDIVIW